MTGLVATSDSKRAVLVSGLLLAAIAISFLLPKPHYESLHILSELKVPEEFGDWKSKDVSNDLNLQDDRYNFISNVMARVYQNARGEHLLLLVLDAGNFHNPKVCYTSSGFSIKELGDAEISTEDRDFKAKALYMERQNTGVLMYYWLCIDKKIVGWTGQKVRELWASLLNKKKAGLMVRLEIPASRRSQRRALTLGRQFIRDLSGSMPIEYKEFLFGN